MAQYTGATRKAEEDIDQSGRGVMTRCLTTMVAELDGRKASGIRTCQASVARRQ